MPFKTKAQRRKFAELLVKGERSPDTFEDWNRETGRKLLPERVAKKKRVAKKTRVTTSRPHPVPRATRERPIRKPAVVKFAMRSRRSSEA
jgi:hypothetical protein